MICINETSAYMRIVIIGALFILVSHPYTPTRLYKTSSRFMYVPDPIMIEVGFDIKELSYNIIISTTYLQSTELNEIFIWLECLKLNIETYENYVGQITQHQTLFS